MDKSRTGSDQRSSIVKRANTETCVGHNVYIVRNVYQSSFAGISEMLQLFLNFCE